VSQFHDHGSQAPVCTLLRRFRSLRSVMVMNRCLPFAWNVSWNGALVIPAHRVLPVQFLRRESHHDRGADIGQRTPPPRADQLVIGGYQSR
jgi:hypothetical protein